MSYFLQAEDGMRCWSVTGVQTCALPITKDEKNQVSAELTGDLAVIDVAGELGGVLVFLVLGLEGANAAAIFFGEDESAYRSEERRVGKEGRFGWRQYDAQIITLRV